MKKIIIPAIIATNQDELNAIFNKIKNNASLVQLDVMDGKFVPNHSLDFDFLFPEEKYKYESHLMVEDPATWIEEKGRKVDTIIAHFESSLKPEEIIKSIKNLGKKVAFALNPETHINSIKDYLDDIDQVLVMTVNPGFYGSPFLPETMEKISELRQIKPELDIEVDGGITPDTIEETCNAGANMFVSGSYLIRSDDIRKRINMLEQKIK